MTFSTPTTDQHDLELTPRPGRRRRGLAVLAVAAVLVIAAASTAAWAWWTGAIGGLPARPHCTSTVLGTTVELDPEQAGNAAVISGVAVRRKLPARAATIGIATAMQESKLYNLSGGDRDSIGLFQQRPSQGWGTAAQVHDPVYASNAFYDVLVKVEGYQNLPITTAAQRVQRSAFPRAYAEHEAEARSWSSGLSGYSPASLSCVLGDPVGHDGPPDADGLTARARAVSSAATTELGRVGEPVPGSGGTTLRFAAASREPTRMAWALAQWAVARADGLAVTSVQVDGRQWRRAAGGKGWTTSRTTPGDGTVLIRTG